MEVQGLGGIPEGGAMASAHVPSNATRNSGEHASQQDQAHRSPTAPSAHATANPAATTTTATTVRREVELTDAGTRLKLQGKLDEGADDRARAHHSAVIEGVVLTWTSCRCCFGGDAGRTDQACPSTSQPSE